MSTKQLPAQPDLVHLKYQARDLLAAARAGEPAAAQRLAQHHPDFANLSPTQAASRTIKLADAQLVIAREYGYPSWSKLKAAVSPVSRQRVLSADLAHNEERALAILGLKPDGLKSTIDQIRRCLPAYASASDAEIKAAKLTEDDARLIYACDHGFPDWEKFREHLAAIASGMAEEPMIAARDAAVDGDEAAMAELLRRHPDLATATGTNGNALLPIAVGRGHRKIVEMLLAAGARVDRNARGEGGTPLMMALFWGNDAAADAIARHGIAPLNLRTAAGLGRLDLVKSFFDGDGKLKPGAGAHRGFYRPHGGFPGWKPSNSRQEILDEAFTYACRNGRTGVLGFLLKMGADIDGDPYRGTGLIWAAFKGQLDVIRWLLDHGAEIDRAGTFGGPSHGQGLTALHLAAGSGQTEAVKLLIERGASMAKRDALHGGSAIGWASFHQNQEAKEYLSAFCTIGDAAYFGYIERVRALLEADPGQINGSEPGVVPLIRAVTGNQPAIVALLLDRGADPNAVDKDGKTALQIAEAEGYEEIARTLRAHGG